MKKQTKEVEVKAKLIHPTAVIQKLQRLGCTLSSPLIQNDTIYLPHSRKADPTTVPSGVISLRIRKENERHLLTFKKTLTNQLDCLEYELEITDIHAMDAIIQELGFYTFSNVHKKRLKTHYNSYEICIDVVEGLGSFIEVEQLTTKDSAIIQKELMDFLITLGVSESDRVHEGYDILLAKQSQKNAQ